MTQTAPYQDYVDRLTDLRDAQSEEASAADQLLYLRDAVRAKPNGTFLELGTWKGQATKTMLNGMHGGDGLLVSVDIEDCSSAGDGPNWQFVQSDSKDANAVLSAAPTLNDGIDLVYVDSMHTVAQVYAEIMAWFPKVRRGGRIVFDDVDPVPYMYGNRKDSARKEMINRALQKLICELFYANLDCLRMEMKFGSTGLAIWTKTSDFGAQLRPYVPMVPARLDTQLADLHDLLRGHSAYRNSETATSVMIPLGVAAE
ncbi:class I SAM-dependent methyltransferase [Shimia sagamensis]|uniref:Methyltransferase domain-containing protein n=1 Tax=Shimia sagamensis TaxID=1566352 RepID=A0ABY1NL75_9RHOB|nr:class I SAM-dependent methyltransferase [Shimia sagamensis]SMP12589.1 Methyltransferase domain-containing protein [Shimia sagamensis]